MILGKTRSLNKPRSLMRARQKLFLESLELLSYNIIRQKFK